MNAAAQVARVEPGQCIGCTLCIAACPFDAIAGATQQGHAVVPDLCTACGLCLPACPVDCIALQPDPAHARRDRRYRTHARDRARRCLRRRTLRREAHELRLQQAHECFRSDAARQAAIAAALRRTSPRADA